MIATVTLNPSLDEWMELPTVRLGQLNRATGFARYPGGKGINVSRVVRELGQRTTAYALAGGEDGQMLRRLMDQLAIPHEFVAVSGSTRNNYKIHTQHPRHPTEINTPGPMVSATALQTLKRRVMNHRPRPRVVALCGSLPPGASVFLYAQWIHTLRQRRIPTVLDTSGAALRRGLTARPWLIKPNRQEAEELLARRLTTMRTIVRSAVDLLAQGPALVVLSLGREGAVLAAAPGHVWLARPPAVHVRSAVGAGDSLVGGFLVGWLGGRSLVECFRLGVACGAASALTSGTELCHRKDVRRLLSRVTIRRLI
ncbi:MAG: 1-phosphofructokinase [Candidatus Omnitrophica bacterium]|nr:1-phosphofructokinase [Candidatus Omnitrophota bacterium]